MFTGIITDVGRVAEVEKRGDTRFVIETAFDTASIAIGASVAHNGCCLTVVEKEAGRYVVEASAETLSKTTLGEWKVGTAVNLEQSMRLGDEIGGHLVYGHVDGLATVVERRPEGDSVRFTFELPAALARFVAPKGSVAIDGVSLTVNEVGPTLDGKSQFGVNIIAHTQSCTTFQTLSPGHRVNFEADMLARYVARLTETRPQPQAIPA
ncbi:riboflavin synthase [Inquilinus sp. CAU 1745]|uniref:riboflavin synthase n=1 Tax=Inquilinus sp. CAU 1745 TaxID=3140369 RepID=UPI00325B3199